MSLAAGFTAFLASHIQDASGNPLTGTLEVVPTNAKDCPIDAIAGGAGGAISKTPTCVAVTTGAVPTGFCVADTSLTSPANISYRVTIKNPLGQPVWVMRGLQPTGPSFDLDTYSPGAPPVLTGSPMQAFTVVDLQDGNSYTLSVNGGALQSTATRSSYPVIGSPFNCLIDTVTGQHYLVGTANGAPSYTPVASTVPGVAEIPFIDSATLQIFKLTMVSGAETITGPL